MKITNRILLFATSTLFFISCSVFNKPKEGCPSNGKNIGAERINDMLDSNKKIPKAKKFKH